MFVLLLMEVIGYYVGDIHNHWIFGVVIAFVVWISIRIATSGKGEGLGDMVYELSDFGDSGDSGDFGGD